MQTRIKRKLMAAAALRRRVAAAVMLVLGGLSGWSAAQAGLLFDPDPNWAEEEVALPASLDRGQLQRFKVEAGNANQHYIDTGSLSVGSDGVVRYVLLITTPGGAENISFEGLRCASGQWRRYASADAGGEWLPARKAQWQAIGDRGRNRPRAALAYDYFCDGPAAPRDREHALRLLRSSRDSGSREVVR